MGRRKRTEEQQARRALISELLSAANVQSMDDIQELFKETIAEFVEVSLESELDNVAVMETLIYNVQRLTNYEEKQNEIQRRRSAELE